MANPVAAQPDCNAKRPRLATGVVQSTHHQLQEPHGEGRSEGGDRCGSVEGERIRRGGTPRGGPGAAKRCAGLMRPSVGDIRGDPTTRAGAPFAPWTELRIR